MSLDTEQADTPTSASFPYRRKAIAVCDHPAVCCELGLDERVHVEGSTNTLWATVPNNSMEEFFQCQYCMTRLYRCRRRRDLHERSCGQHYEPHETSVCTDTQQASTLAPKPSCEHITCFCSNGLRIIPRENGHLCGDCGIIVDMGILFPPCNPCNCCCHEEGCDCCFYCRMRPCHCPAMQMQEVLPQFRSLEPYWANIHLLSPETLDVILACEVKQVSCDLQTLRLCHTPEGDTSVWIGTGAHVDTRNSAKAERLRKFALSLPSGTSYTLPFDSNCRAKLIQFCDAVIVLELNFHIKLLHPNVQLEHSWTPFGIQPCCDKARMWSSQRLTRIVCALATWSDAWVQFKDLGNFIRMLLVCKQWRKATSL